MAKNIKRLFAMSLVVCMLIAALPMQALAAESVSTETSPEGLITDVKTTTDSVPDADGNTVVTVTIEKDTEGTLDDGSHLDRSESFESSWTYDENGNLVSKSGINIGSETITEIIVLPDGGIIVKVPSVGKAPNSVEFGDTSLNGTVGDSENYTTTTVTPGSVTVSNNGITYEQEFTDRDGLTYTHGTVTPDGTNDVTYKYCADEQYLPGYEGEFVMPEMVEGYDYIYVGAGLTSKFTPARVHEEPWSREDKIKEKGDEAFLKPGMTNFSYFYNHMDESERESIAYNEDGSYVVDEEGYILNKDRQRVVKGERTHIGPDGEVTYLHRFDNFAVNSTTKIEGWYEDGEWIVPVNGTGYIAMWDGPQQYLLVDSNGNIITTYCADQTDPTEDFYGYNIENLEDATYYSEEEAARIRAIAKNGYWGVTSEAGEANPAEGSLEYLKQVLLASGQFTVEDLASLNDGVALTATQMAIWSCSNKMSGINYVGSHYSDFGAGAIPAGKKDEVELMFEIYEFLTGLEGIETRGDMADTVITAENAITNMNVNVIQKADGHINNADNDNTNDAYVTDLSFALVVEPTGSDDESLKVTLITSDGQTIVGRICGAKDSEDEIDLVQDADGNYWFRNIVLTEKDGQTFTLNLEGVQNLEQGVYLYSSEVRDGSTSQTLVGKAGGVRDFDVSISLSFSVDVEEGLIVTERVWNNEFDPGYGNDDPVDPNPIVPRWNPPENNRLANEGEIIEEEEVPLAAPVSTGDNTGLWIALFMMIVFGIVALNFFDKKRHHTTF